MLAPEEAEVAALEEWDVSAGVAAAAAVVAVAIANLAAVDPGMFAVKIEIP